MEVNSESLNLLNDRGSYQISNCPMYYISTPLRKNGVSLSNTSKEIGILEFERYWLYHRRILNWSSSVASNCVFIPFRPYKWLQDLWYPKHSAYWFPCVHQSASSVGKIFEFCSFFLQQKAAWFGQDQGPLAQAIKRVGMALVIPTAIVSLRLSCNRLPFNMYSPWQAPWRS